MQDRHVDQVMNIIRQVLNISSMPEASSRLRTKLKSLNLKRGPEPNGLGRKRDSKSLWIKQARVFARRYAAQNGTVDIETVCQHVPLPPTADRRIIGGVLKHEDFVRTGFKQKKVGRTFRTVGVFALKEHQNDSEDKFDDVITDW